MRIVMFVLVAVSAVPGRATELGYDQQLAIKTARECIESGTQYAQRIGAERPDKKSYGAYDFSNPTIKEASRKAGKDIGYVAVFFPAIDRSDFAYAYLEIFRREVGEPTTDIECFQSSWVSSISDNSAEFFRHVKSGHYDWLGNQ